MNFIMGNELKENNSLLRDIVVMIKKIKKRLMSKRNIVK